MKDYLTDSLGSGITITFWKTIAGIIGIIAMVQIGMRIIDGLLTGNWRLM